MQKHYNYLNIDLDKKIHTKLKAKQGDSKSRYILVNLISNSTYYDLSDCAVKIYGIKKDKTIFFNHATVTNGKQGQFEVELTTQALAVPGEIEIQILILGTNDEKLTTFSFFIDVEKTIIDDAAIESTNEFTALTEALSSVQNIDNRFNEVNEQFNTIINNSSYKNVRTYGITGNYDDDITDKLQSVFNLGGNIYIPEGEYRIDKTIVVKEGTNLLMSSNAKLYNNIHQSQPKGLKGISIFSNYNVDDLVNGYNLPSNITIEGGQLIGIKTTTDKEMLTTLGDIGQDGISISHGENITIKNVLVKDTFRGHGIEITGCNNVLVDSCIIDGCILTEIDVTRVREAIQLEHSGTNTSPSKQDKTLCKNITVKNCIITRTNPNSSYWGSGIGSHNNDNEGIMENIIFENNKIYNCLHAGVMLINYKNSKIINNYITGSDWGIGYYQSRPLANVTIEGNIFENHVKGGISIDKGSYGLTILNNRFENIQGSGVSLVDSTNLIIDNNRFLNCGIDSVVNGIINVYGIKYSDISNNYFYKTVDNTVKRAIFINGTDEYINSNVTYNNNKVEFECSEEDIYLHSTARNNTPYFQGTFGIYNNNSISLKKSIYNYKAVQIDTNNFGSIVVPVTAGAIKVVLSDIGNGSNAFTAIEFTINIDTLGKTLTIVNTRYMSISAGSQNTQDITQGLSININKIVSIC